MHPMHHISGTLCEIKLGHLVMFVGKAKTVGAGCLDSFNVTSKDRLIVFNRSINPKFGYGQIQQEVPNAPT